MHNMTPFLIFKQLQSVCVCVCACVCVCVCTIGIFIEVQKNRHQIDNWLSLRSEI